MPFRVSFFMQQKADLTAGWSENFWSNKIDLADVITTATALRNALMQIHGNQTFCETVRISDASNFRDVQILRFPNLSTPPTGGVQDSDFYNVGALMRLKGGNNYIVRQIIRSTDDADINSGGRWNPRPATVTRLNALKAILTSASNAWVLRVQDRTVAKLVVGAITNAGVVTVAGHGYATNDSVRISRARGTFNVNQIWQINVIDANNFSLVGWVAPNPAGVYTGHGTSQQQKKIFVQISDVTWPRAASHKSGRPFGLASGKQKTKAK